MYVIGTAGHVDHGKSTLIEALTGIDPDRLAEEKEREMTIDLGFAWITLGADGRQEEVGIIDVPGHRDFIENMLAGVGGVDLALFVVAADEGVMPQTKEHLAILDLLQTGGGVVALTKTDLIDDPDWLELVTLELAETLEGTVLADAPILPVSAKTGAGLDELKTLLWERLAAKEPRPDNGRPRLSVDRVFSLSGFGTIVTGTLIDGRFRIGDQIEIQPSGKKGRVRGLQTHKTKLKNANPGSRVAINLSGIDRDEVKRGDVVAAPDIIRGSILLDAAYRHLPDALTPLKHNMEVKLFVGAAEVVARARVIGSKQIEAGQEGWLQLALSHSIAAARGDRFILRRPSPGMTMGGGRILDPHPGRRHRRYKGNAAARLETLSKGSPAELLTQRLARIEPTAQAALLSTAGLDIETATAALQELEQSGQIIRLGKYLMTQAGWRRRINQVSDILAAYHRASPLRVGMPREELRSRLKLKPAVFNPLLEQAASEGVLVDEGAIVHAPDHEVIFSESQKTAVSALFRRMGNAGAGSPSVKMCKTAVGEDIYFALADLGRLRQLNNEVVYAAAEYEQIRDGITAWLRQNGQINAAQTRDLIGASRKYAIAFLEHLDDIKTTRRVGDYRELRGG